MDLRRRGTVGLLVGLLCVTVTACAQSAPAEGTRESSPTTSGTPAPDVVRPSDLPAAEPKGPTENLVPSNLASLVEDYNASPPRGPSGGTVTSLRGADVGWPQCPKGTGIPEKQGQGQPMPVESAEFVIVGLTNSPSFTRNPCLDDQIEWARDRGLLIGAYAILSYPDEATVERLGSEGPHDGDTRLGALRNVGHQAALFNVVTMADSGLESPVVWIDVEAVPRFEWSSDKQANAAVVQGAVRGYREQGLTVGFYSLPSMWSNIVGELRFGAPEWRPAGASSVDGARARCAAQWSFQGGEAVFGQWVEDHRDHNVSCPGVRLDPERWFHRF